MTENREKKVGGLLLAAGGSRRLGRPKQLLKFQGRTLLRRSVETLVGTACNPIVVVLGAEIERSKAEIDGLDVSLVINADWQNGMSSSIRVGLEKLLLLEPGIDAVMITLCDQPLVTAEHIELFLDMFEQNDVPIIAAKYNGVLGVPTLFSREMFYELSNLQGNKGARDLIRQTDSTLAINLPDASVDIDAPDDIIALED